MAVGFRSDCLTVLSVVGLRLISSNEGKEGNVLLNDALNTFYLRLYGVGPAMSAVVLSLGWLYKKALVANPKE